MTQSSERVESSEDRQFPFLRHILANDREIVWLRKLVEIAVALELATLPPYLTAYWSIKDPEHPVAKSLFEVILEEMQHLGTACNLLVGLGGTVDLHAAALRYPTALPGGVQPELTLTLQGLNPASIELFMAIEYPENGAPGFTPEGATSHTIGEFYSLLEEGLAIAPAKLETQRQVEGMGLKILASINDVHEALEIIKRQGEGSQYSPTEGGTLSHYYRFKEMALARRYRFDTAKKAWDWAEAIDVPGGDGVWPAIGISNTDVRAREIEERLAAFDARYGRLLTELESAWASGDGSILKGSARLMGALGQAATDVMRTPLSDSIHMAPRFLPTR